jgi:hypothetical protein
MSSPIGLAPMADHVIVQQGLVLRRDSRPDRVLDYFSLARHEIDAEFVSQIEKVTSGMTVTFGELIDELLNAGCGLGDDLFFFTLL